MQYRADIQVLRGVAVLLVVLFHLEFFLLPAGFLGVDMFFVISGYLMAGLYQPGQAGSFYARRAKRLLPAYFAVVVLTGLAGMFVVTPNSYGQLLPQLGWASAFMSNMGFWLDDSYFEKLSFRPLLHLWSLGVEIQFYLLLPLLAAFFRRVRGGLWLVLAVSFLLCGFMVTKSPKTAFLWMPFRVWEFLLGYACLRWHSAWQGRSQRYTWVTWLALVGVVCLAALPVDGIRPSVVWGHPGLAALAMVVLTGVLLVFGLPLQRLQRGPLAWLKALGDRSYSIYLVHFPLITFVLYEPSANLTPATAPGWLLACVVVAMLALGEVSYRWLEKLPRGWALSRYVAGALVAVVGVILSTSWVQKQWIPPDQLPVYEARLDADTFRCGRVWRAMHLLEKTCLITPPVSGQGDAILLLGNSHADAIKHTFAEVAVQHGRPVWFMADNTPLMDYGAVTVDTVMAEIKSRRIRTVVMHYSPGALPLETLARFVGSAAVAGVTVHWLAPVPVWPEHVPMMLWRAKRGDGVLAAQTDVDYLRASSPYLEGVRALNAQHVSVHLIHPFFCQPDCRLIDAQNRPYYRDDAHLSLTGSRLLSPLFEKLMQSASSP